MRGWRNWQTRTFEGRVGDRTGSSPVLRTTIRVVVFDGSDLFFLVLFDLLAYHSLAHGTFEIFSGGIIFLDRGTKTYATPSLLTHFSTMLYYHSHQKPRRPCHAQCLLGFWARAQGEN